MNRLLHLLHKAHTAAALAAGCLATLLLCSACQGKQEPDQGQLAAIAAKGYYDLLLEGKYEDYVAGTYQPDSIPEGYRKQLVLSAKMYVEGQQEEHKGINQVNILTAKADTARHVADVYLSLVYGDSLKEQIVVPMVQARGKWMMR